MTDLGYCRLCAEIKKSSTLVIINKNENDSNVNLCDKIRQFFQIQIRSEDREDNLPKTICLDCCTQTNLMYEFYQKVHKAQEFLRNVIFNPAINKNSTNFLSISSELDVKDETKKVQRTNVKNEISSESSENDNVMSLPEQFDSEEDIKKLELESKNDQKNTQKKKRFRVAWKDYEWPCNKCEDVFKQPRTLAHHSEEVHGTPAEFKCPECSECYKIFKSFSRHFRKHRNYQKFRCHLCNKAFNDSTYLRKHLNLFHEQISIERKKCKICEKDFKTRTALNHHIRSTHEVPKYVCDICNKKVRTKYTLQAHKKIHDDSAKSHVCDQCGVRFRLKAAFLYHLENVHRDIKEDNFIQCPKCPKKFKNKVLLQKHTRQIHSGEIRFECETCGKQFYLQTCYTLHVRVHSGERPYKCQHCEKGFRTNAKLKIHMRQHTGEKPYRCTYCDHDFTDLSNFWKHSKVKHGVTSMKELKELSKKK